MEFKEYQKYRWFVTLSGKLVIGGKNALQNEFLLRKLKSEKKDFLVMHTAEPGSPFSVILSDTKSIKESDLEECAIFTAAFSRAWKLGKKKASVDVFKVSDLYKLKDMKPGTWGVKQKMKNISTQLQLVLTKQKNKIRAVPEKSVKSKKDILLKIMPGKIDKQLMLAKLQVYLSDSYSREDLLSALPAGGIQIKK